MALMCSTSMMWSCVGWAIGDFRMRRSPPAVCESPAMLMLITSLKLLTEIALMALLGQFVLGLLTGARRHTNLFYRLLGVVTRPVLKLSRWITPRVVLDRHLPLVAFLWLAALWLLATWMKISVCMRLGVQACR